MEEPVKRKNRYSYWKGGKILFIHRRHDYLTNSVGRLKQYIQTICKLKCKNKFPCIGTKNMKYITLNLTRNFQDLYGTKYKI